MFCTSMNMLFFVFVLLFMDWSCDTRTQLSQRQFKDENAIEAKTLTISQSSPKQAIEENAIEAKTPTISPQNKLDPGPEYNKNIFIYAGIAVLLAVVIITQIICFCTYIRSVRATRETIDTIIRSTSRNTNSTVRATRETIDTIIRSTSRNTNSTVRYSKTPTNSRTRNQDIHVYESLTDLDKIREPVPPPLETLPRIKIPPPPIEPMKPSIMEQMSSISSLTESQSSFKHAINSIQKIPTIEPNPVINRPKLPEPNEIPEKPATLPKKYKSTRINKMPLPSMSVPRSDVDKNELMEKLKKRQLLADNEISRSVSNVSLTSVHSTPLRQPKRTAAAPMPPPKPYGRNDSNDSDDEWTIEPLKPINLYNI